jgi:hypothetical protein
VRSRHEAPGQTGGSSSTDGASQALVLDRENEQTSQALVLDRENEQTSQALVWIGRMSRQARRWSGDGFDNMGLGEKQTCLAAPGSTRHHVRAGSSASPKAGPKGGTGVSRYEARGSFPGGLSLEVLT